MKNRQELLKIFKDADDILKYEGLRNGQERFYEFVNILFLKILKEQKIENLLDPYWDHIKYCPDDSVIANINNWMAVDIQRQYNIKKDIPFKEDNFKEEDYDIFTPLKIKDPNNLRQLVSLLDSIDFSQIDTDIKGDAFEFFIKTQGSALGEYFTPREVVKTIISIVNPVFGEKIYDPFCGTGGFLIQAIKYIKDNIKDVKPLSLQMKDCLENHTIYGGEISSNARIAKMNLLLQGNAHRGIKKIDSLANPIEGLYDIVLANMPFSMKLIKKTTAEGKITNDISSLYYDGLAGNRGDGVCVLHCLKSLKKGGRMALVVPEGFLFRKDVAKIRKYLLTNAKLACIISLPQGVFLPYTNVKTSILYFTDVHMPNTQKVIPFYEVKTTGFSLNNHKRPIEGENDLDKICSLPKDVFK